MLTNTPIIPDLNPIKQQLQNTPSNILFPPFEICDFYTINENSVIYYQHTPQYYNYFKLITAITQPHQTCSNTKIYIHYISLFNINNNNYYKILKHTNNILFTYTLNLSIETETELISKFLSLQLNTTIISETNFKHILNILPQQIVNCEENNYTLYFYYIQNYSQKNTCPKLNTTTTN